MNYHYQHDPEKYVALLTALALVGWVVWRAFYDDHGGRKTKLWSATLALFVAIVVIGVPVAVWLFLESVTKGMM